MKSELKTDRKIYNICSHIIPLHPNPFYSLPSEMQYCLGMFVYVLNLNKGIENVLIWSQMKLSLIHFIINRFSLHRKSKHGY